MNRFELRDEGALSYGELAAKREAERLAPMPRENGMFDGTWGDDIIDTRDVIEWLDKQGEDAEEGSDAAMAVSEAHNVLDMVGAEAKYGVTLVLDSYFEDYARELASDVDLVSGEEMWPLTCIDWGRAAKELQTDYTPIEVDGFTYWAQV